ncbi:MAG: radical SAM family heme chaperone HemW [Treponema sp.]|nr:radical SAM family heme chaperone HemW [Treponema sp.]
MKSCSLYIHIPFCRSKCDYCDFFSIPVGNTSVPDTYLSAVKKEISWYVERYSVQNWNTVYIGGGTPSLILPEQLYDLVSYIRNTTPENFIQEITVEMNPENVNESLLNAAAESGVSRISVGIQSTDDHVLQAVHRTGSVTAAKTALSLIKSKWNGQLSVDLIAGLPESDTNEYVQGIKKIAACDPDHISLYALTVEPKTPLGARTDFSSDTIQTDKQWILGRDLLEKLGYKQYEVSNFAKKGFESRHNLAYWLQDDYIGCGAGAVGTVYDFENTGLRWSDTHNIAAYTLFWNNQRTGTHSDEESIPGFIRKTELLDKKTMEFEYFMMGLRLLRGIDAENFYNRYKYSMTDIPVFREKGLFSVWMKKGLAHRFKKNNHTFYALTRKGLLFLNIFLENIDIEK